MHLAQLVKKLSAVQEARVQSLGRGWGVGWRFLGEGDGNSLHYSHLENPMNRGASQRTTVHGVAESDTTEAT